jgi:hypothetical protein
MARWRTAWLSFWGCWDVGKEGGTVEVWQSSGPTGTPMAPVRGALAAAVSRLPSARGACTVRPPAPGPGATPAWCATRAARRGRCGSTSRSARRTCLRPGGRGEGACFQVAACLETSMAAGGRAAAGAGPGCHGGGGRAPHSTGCGRDGSPVCRLKKCSASSSLAATMRSRVRWKLIELSGARKNWGAGERAGGGGCFLVGGGGRRSAAGATHALAAATARPCARLKVRGEGRAAAARGAPPCAPCPAPCPARHRRPGAWLLPRPPAARAALRSESPQPLPPPPPLRASAGLTRRRARARARARRGAERRALSRGRGRGRRGALGSLYATRRARPSC